jgi:hypothetical protein
MIPQVFELLSASCHGKKPDDLVFTRAGSQHVCDPRKEWYDLCLRSGLGHWVPAKLLISLSGDVVQLVRTLPRHWLESHTVTACCS